MKKINIEWLNDWYDDLIWCPSQLQRKFSIDNSTYVLYCRWRWDDPWSFAFYKESTPYDCSTVIFDKWINLGYGLTEEDSVEDIHKYAENLLLDYLSNKGN